MIQERVALPHTSTAVALEERERSQPQVDADNITITLPLPALPFAYRVAKRTLDVVVAAAVLLLVSPLLVVTAALIHLTSKGPALFTQQRVGEGGRIFTMYKFRSMYVDADHSVHQMAYAHFVGGKGGDGKVSKETLARAGASVQPAPQGDDDEFYRPRRRRWLDRKFDRVRPLLRAEDTRITPIGAIIRITSIDELPQLFNVLRGEMSLVGPRPPIPYEVRLYQRKHLLRLTVKPGVTGVWQVYGRNRVPFERMVNMDLAYIRQRSFWLDLKLVVLTAPALLFGK